MRTGQSPSFQRDGRVDDRHGIAQPAAEALHFADDLDVLVPVDAGGHGPHDFPLVEDVDVVVDDDREFQIGHFDEGLHAGFVGLVLEFFFDRDVADAAAAARGGEMNRLDAGNIFLDDVIGAAFFGNAAEIPVVHVAGPEVFDDAAAPVRDRGDFDDRHVHFGLGITEDFAEGILRLRTPGRISPSMITSASAGTMNLSPQVVEGVSRKGSFRNAEAVR